MKKMWIWIAAAVAAVIIALLAFVFALMIIVSSGQDSCFVDNETSGKAAGGVAGGDWSKKGSQTYNNMKYAAEEFKTKLGMSGDNIAAALAEGLRESNFDPKAYNPGGNVRGVWQWSDGGINGNRFQGTGDSIEAQVALAVKELKGPYRITLLKMNGADLENSVSLWATHFEGLPVGDEVQRKHAQTVATAKKVKEVFNLNFEGNLDAGNKVLGNNDSATSGAKDLAGCSSSDSNGTASGLPVQGQYNVTGGYPNYAGKSGSAHYGVDFQTVNHSGDAGNVYSVADGTVVNKTFDPTGGNFVVIKNTDGKYAYYGHAPTLDSIVVKVGDKVKKGQHISHQGQTGMATGVHVHFGLNNVRSVFAPNSPGVTSPGNYLKKLPKKVVVDDNTVIPGGVFNAKN